MKVRAAIAIIVATTVMGVAPAQAVAEHAQASTTKARVSVAVAPATAKVGSVVVLSGADSLHRAAVTLAVQRLVGKHWTTIAHTKTIKAGHYAVRLRTPKKAATWALRVTRTAAVSPTVHLRAVTKSFAVRAATPREVASGAPVVVSGSVSPKAAGLVTLQQLKGSTWRTLASVRLTKSTYRFSKLLVAGTYKLRVLKRYSATIADGHSATLTTTVAAAPVAPVAPVAPPTPAPTPTVTTSAVPSATVGKPYTASLAAAGATPPYTWTASGLPGGLSLSAGGVLAGFPTTAGSSAVTVVVRDATGASGSRAVTLVVAQSASHASILKSWGRDRFGELATGTAGTNSSTPVTVPSLTGVVGAAGSDGNGYAVRDDGTLWAWGSASFGVLGTGTTSQTSVPVMVVGLSGMTAVAAGSSTVMALRYDGTVWTWGFGTSGQLGSGTTVTTATPGPVTGLTNAVAIASSGSTEYALRSDGTVWAWGDGAVGGLGNGGTAESSTPVQVSLPAGITAIAAGSFSGYALGGDGRVWAWGYNDYGQLGDSSVTTRLTPVQVGSITSAIAITAGARNGYAVLADGTVRAWGLNSGGELGLGTTSVDSTTPVSVAGLTGVTAISSCYAVPWARHSDGTVSSWGINLQGQIGNGTTDESHSPVLVAGLTGAISIGSGQGATTAYGVFPPP